jgi:hypothetical protein
MLIANARMYAVNASVAAAWRSLLEWTVARADVPCEVIDYPAPAPLPALWARPDVGCVFMCGYPIATAQPPPRILAAPIPAPLRYCNRPVYCTDIIVRADAPLKQLPGHPWTSVRLHDAGFAVGIPGATPSSRSPLQGIVADNSSRRPSGRW